jgi:hypothetical protein
MGWDGVGLGLVVGNGVVLGLCAGVWRGRGLSRDATPSSGLNGDWEGDWRRILARFCKKDARLRCWCPCVEFGCFAWTTPPSQGVRPH